MSKKTTWILVAALAIAVLASAAWFVSDYFLLRTCCAEAPVRDSDMLLEIFEDPKQPDVYYSPTFGESISIMIGATVDLPDGLKVFLKDINDSRCKPDIQCIWAGEITGVFYAFDGKLNSQRQFNLSTVTSKAITLDGYTFTLINSTESTITFKVVSE